MIRVMSVLRLRLGSLERCSRESKSSLIRDLPRSYSRERIHRLLDRGQLLEPLRNILCSNKGGWRRGRRGMRKVLREFKRWKEKKWLT